MKKVIIIAISIILIAAVVIGAILLIPKKEPTDTLDLNVGNASEFIKELDDEKTEYYKMDDNTYIIPQQTVFNHDADVYFTIDKDKIAEISSNYLIFANGEYSNDMGVGVEDEDMGVGDEEEIIEEKPSTEEKKHKYSSREKSEIQKAINSIKNSFEAKLGCGELKEYVLTPFMDLEGVEVPEDDLQKVLDGYYQMEYSVRAKDGRLWFLWIYSPYSGVVEASVTMVDSTDKYQDFEPIINLK